MTNATLPPGKAGAKPDRPLYATGLSILAFFVVALSELVLIVGVIPAGLRKVHEHPIGELLRPDFKEFAQTTSSIGMACALAAVVSIAAIAYLAGRAGHGRLGLIGAAIVALLGMWQLNVASAIQDVIKLQQPTGKMAIGALNDLKLPAVIIFMMLDLLLAFWIVVTAARARSKP